MPMDAAMTLPDACTIPRYGGRTVAVVRQGLTADRTAFSKRLWRLREKFRPSAVLMLMPDEVRLRHARRLMAGAPSIAFLALERDAAAAGASAPIWRPPSGPTLLDLRTALSYARRRGAWPAEEQPSKVFLPGEITLEGPEHEVPGWMLPALLKPAEKRAVDLLSDWPWIAPAHLGELLGVKRSMLSRILVRLQGLGLAVDLHVEGGRRLALSDRGLAMLARRDRSSVGAARKRWSVTPPNAKAPLDWRNVSGRRSRQLLRNVEHTECSPLVRRRPGAAGALTVQGGRPVRPALTRLKVLPARRPAALHSARRLLRPPQGRKDLALLPGVGTPSRAARYDGGTHRPLPALLLIASAHRRLRRAALGVGCIRGRDRRDPFPVRRERRDGANRDHCAPVRLPQEPAGEGGAAGTGVAGNRRLGTRLRS